jgi:hypothetical protein
MPQYTPILWDLGIEPTSPFTAIRIENAYKEIADF